MKQSTTFAQVATNLFDYLSSALCANTPPYKKHSSSRKFLTLSISLRLLLVMFLTLIVSASAWAETETITLSNFGWSNATVQSSISATSATIRLDKNSAGTAPTYYTSDGLRIYGVKNATTGGTISFTPKKGITISKIVFTHGSSNSGVLAIKTGVGSYLSKTWSGTLTEGSTVSLVSTNNTTSGNPQVKITKIVITYTASSSGSDSGGGDSSGDGDDGCTWELVTPVSTLKVGDEIVIAAKDYSCALSTTQNSNNRGQASIIKDGNSITFGNDVQILTLEQGSVDGTFAFYTGNGYLYAASSSSNHLKTLSVINANASWGISITGDGTFVAARGTYTRNVLNYNQSSKLFSCYDGQNQQQPIVIYKKVCSIETAVTLHPNGGTISEDGWETTDGGDTYTKNVETTSDVTLPTPTKDGYEFGGWYEYSEFTGSAVTAVPEGTEGGKTYYAKWNCTAPTNVAISGSWDRFGGETISLIATPTGGTGDYSYQWQKYYGSTWNNITDNATATTANLEYKNCDGSHSGTYRCVVSTGADCSTESDGLQVKVYTLECYTNGTNIYHFTRNGNTQSGTLTLNLNANTAYKFKVHVDNDYYGNGGTINKDETNWVLGAELGTPDLTVNSGLGGTFTFTIDYSESGNSNTLGVPEISVTYPCKTIYLNPGVWNTEGAKYAIYYFIDGQDAWSDLFVGDACGTYTTIPQWNGVTMIAVRLSSDATGGTWDKKWNQTGNIPVNNNDYIAITGWGDGDSPHTYTTYTPATYSITFNGNGNTGGSMTKVTGITCGEDHTLAANGFARTGYTFAGWATSVNGEKVYDDKATISNITSNITLYAKWTPNANTAYTVKHYKQQLDGTYSDTPDETQNLTGTTAASVTPAVKSYTGFTAPSTQTVTIKSDGSTVVTYQYTRNSYTLTWNLADGTITEEGTAAGQVKFGAPLTAPTVEKADYKFNGWSPSVPSKMPAENASYTAQWIKAHTVTWKGATYNGTQNVVNGDAVGTLPEDEACSDTYTTFIGWYTKSSGVETNPSAEPQGEEVTAETKPTKDVTYYAVWADGSGNTSTVDELTRETTGVSGTSYASWSGKKASSSAVYAGQTSGGPDNNTPCIQLRSNNSNSGVVTTTSGGKAKVIAVTWNAKTENGRTLNVYGKNSAYTAATDLYNNSNWGTLLGTIVKGTSTELTISGDYEYIGLRSASGAMYLDEIQITWSSGVDPTGYISSCCQSQAVVTVAPQATELALNIDGTASTTVNISQEGAGNGRYHQPIISPAEGASLNWTGEYKQKAYDLTFTATQIGTYTITADFTETEAACPRYGTATINVVANPILVVSEPTISSQCGTASVPVAVTIDSRYLTGSSLTAQVTTTEGNGQFEICKTENGIFTTTNLTNIEAGKDDKESEIIYVRYVAGVDDITPAVGTLTISDGTTTKTVTLNTTPTCGTSIRMTASDANSIRVTTANGQWTRTQTPIQLRGAYLLQNLEAGQGAKVVLTSSNSNFKFVKSDVQSAGTATFESEKITTETWEQNIHLVYTPTTYNANETATITAKVITFGGNTEHASSTMEAYGRSFPETFVLALNTGDGWVALPADMTAPYGTSCNTGVGTHDPYPITVDDEANPTAATLAPARAVYKGAARNTPMTNPWTIQLESNELTGYYLFGSNKANNTISNSDQATGEGIKWALSTSDNITYQLSQTTVTEGQKLGYNGTHKVMGQYRSAAVTYKYDFRILPIDGTICTYFVKPVLTLVSFDDNNITYTTPYDGTLNYKISADGGNTWTELTGVLDCKTLSFTLPVATYRGKTIIVKPNAAEEDCVTASDPVVIPNPTIDRGETPWRYTGVVGKPFSDNSKSITINDLQNALNVAVIQQVTNSNISASITLEGVVTVSMDAEDATEGEHKAVLEFTSAGAETQRVGVVITIKSLALQEFDGGNEYLFTESTPIVLCHNEMISLGETPTVYLSYPLYMNGSLITELGQFNQTSLTLTDLTSGTSMAAVSREMNGNGVVKLTFGNSITDDLIVGHMYRLSWENTNQVMTDQIGLPYTDCVMDFVFSENCDAPTALQACPVTNSGFTANWAPVQDCDGNVTVEVYTKGEVATLLDKTSFSTTEVKALSKDFTSTNWVTNKNNTNAGDPSISDNRLLISEVSTPTYYNLFSPQLSNFGSFDESTTYTITITLYQATNDAGAGAYFYVMDNGSDLKKSTIPTITDKTVLIDEQSVTSKKLTYGTTTFTVKGLSSDDRIRLLGFESSSIASEKKNVYISSIKIEGPGAGDVVATKNVSCAAGSVEFTGLDANTQYYYTVSDGANTSREIAVETYNNDPQVKFYNDENNTKELIETVVVDGKTTTVYLAGQNISGCDADDVVAYISSGYRVNSSALVYDPKTATISGSVELTLTEPSVINGTLTIKDGVNQTYNLPIVSGSNMELQVVEWKASSAVVMYNGDPEQSAQMTINGVVVGSVTLSNTKKDIAVYELPFAGLNTNPNQYLTITINDKKTLIQAPYIVSEGNTAAVPANADMVVLKGQTFTANGETLNNVTIYGDGKLVVPAEKGFGVNTLTLRIGGVTADGSYDYVYPEFVLDGTWTNTSGKINLDYVTTKEQYYTFAAPFAVQTKDIHYPVDIYGNNVAANNRGSFEFQYYDGAARAAGERGWKVVEEDLTNGATLTAHKGYTFYGMPKKVSVNGGTSTRQKFGIHRIPMMVTAANAMSHENSEQTIAVVPHPSEKNINSGWNLIGNPYMSTITGLDNESIVTGSIVLVDNRWEWSNDETYNQRFIVFPSNDGEWYYTSQASNATLPAFKNFFVQIDNEANALSIPYTHRASGSAAPARRVAEDMDKDIELAIVLEQDDKYADQMDFLLNDAYSAIYDRNADFTKMMNNTNLNLFGVHLDDYLSFMAIDTYTARSSVAIGYQVPQAGQYTLRLSDKPYVMWSMVDAIYVTDHEVTPEVTTNLLDEAYTFQVTNAETNTTRFSISIVPSKESGGTTTAIDDILHQDMQTQKIIYNDQLYILRGGVVYDAMGQRVTSINK